MLAPGPVECSQNYS